MLIDGKILVGVGDCPVWLLPKMANRHGVIAGATGTGKTTTLKILAEGFADLGVPVFLADVKGDVSSLAMPGECSESIQKRLERMGISQEFFTPSGYACRFWDVFGQYGIPIRATVSDMGPTLLGRLLGLTEIQTGVLNIAFHLADDKGWKLIDYKDLKEMLMYVADHRTELTTEYGNVTAQSVGAIQRALLTLEDQGGELFFGEPDLDIEDWFANAADGRGMINILHGVELCQHPLLYATFMLWMLSEIYERLPEVGDLEQPRMVFFFDEAHLMFRDAPKAMLEKVEQVVKLVRSKGVGIYFISQSLSDIPDSVLAQLNNRIQHAIHAYTPAEMKAVKVAAQSFRRNPAFKTEDAIAALEKGEALVSLLDENGAPCVVERAIICPPQSSFTPLDDETRSGMVQNDGLYTKYAEAIDRESAYEILSVQRMEEQRRKQEEEERKAAEKAAKQAEKERLAQYKAEGRDRYGRTRTEQTIARAASSAGRSIGRDVGKQITRGIFGTATGNMLNRAVGNAAGSVVGSALGDMFKRRW